MSDMSTSLNKFAEIETGEAFTLQNTRLLKVELSATTVMARSGAMVAYQGDVNFKHKGGGVGRMLKKAATGEGLRLMECNGTGEVFLANHAMLVHVVRLSNDSLTVSGENILAFETGIEWDVTRVKGGATGIIAGGLFNIHLKGNGLVALISDGEPIRLDVAEALDVRGPAGRDRVVGRRPDQPEDRHAGQIVHRHGLRREHPARHVRPGLGARAALRGPAGRRVKVAAGSHPGTRPTPAVGRDPDVLERRVAPRLGKQDHTREHAVVVGHAARSAASIVTARTSVELSRLSPGNSTLVRGPAALGGLINRRPWRRVRP